MVIWKKLPYYNDLVKSAPLAVSIEEFQQYFRVHHHLTERLNYILKDQSKIEDSLLQAGAISALDCGTILRFNLKYYRH